MQGQAEMEEVGTDHPAQQSGSGLSAWTHVQIPHEDLSLGAPEINFSPGPNLLLSSISLEPLSSPVTAQTLKD